MYSVTILPLVAVLFALLAQMRGMHLHGLMAAAALGFVCVTVIARIVLPGEGTSAELGNYTTPALLMLVLSLLHYAQSRWAAPLSPKTCTIAFWALLGSLLAPGVAIEIAGAINPGALSFVAKMGPFAVMLVLTCVLLLVALPVIALIKAKR